MNDIAAFLRARYEERRALALSASPGPWRSNEEHDEIEAVDGITVAEGFALSGRQLRATVDHIAANEPTAVVADLDAKLALLDEHHDVNDGDCGTCVNGRWGYPTHGGSSPQRYPCRTLRILAHPFAGHPDHEGERWDP